ncbi:hypothetical protein BOTBODRAFT_563956 [Botryobasidium botryosum FD-172 SS1]|uniref:Uncharacterized protein n=1 Tax=Botryobasidium botryosum (strain FD-172 SS1) TaxID=930990 RepID=A0A067LYM9_BOTB1|nr:hypothetical protein BOTBODRAFT_563956 [Botryobasidium botryosum FD-172 SS1]
MTSQRTSCRGGADGTIGFCEILRSEPLSPHCDWISRAFSMAVFICTSGLVSARVETRAHLCSNLRRQLFVGCFTAEPDIQMARRAPRLVCSDKRI